MKCAKEAVRFPYLQLKRLVSEARAYVWSQLWQEHRTGVFPPVPIVDGGEPNVSNSNSCVMDPCLNGLIVLM